jgi:hypothetical protein
MFMRAVAALFTANAVLPYYTLDNRMSSLMSYEHGVSWDDMREDKYCMHTINVPTHADPVLRSMHCYTKCAGGSDEEDCSDFDALIDGPNEDSLCASPEALLVQCAQMDDCWGVTHNTGLNHGYLNTFACATDGAVAYAEGRDVYVKSITAPHTECQLGVGVEVFFSGKSGPTAGLYEENADKMGYTQVSPDFGSKVMWHSSGCGWVVVQNHGV